ncbi:IcmH (DotU) [Legionella geestiana]|uniref:IcmH (DotU) n=1 Tax=Legionella geestiana TaxID=45065 RepID=A0A0W0TGK5_9GAMM|nr:type IVB secretion system protein IcmH/DotU [Legionella geestiana]KTC94751.1 IcmH (DotU) [Legionella geestiana]QBS12694.1 DotU family type IV/VI secretion system protein [Legionella geestiana]QDQ39589.1 DotU family type IV/VI secretion system protein [Legionella geestiana]STX54840.1 IcmH (DotU) [Legionella geestiana]
MAAELQSAFIAGRLAVPATHKAPQGYYRSRLFATPVVNNPLVAAASPLLSMLERLCVSPSLPALPVIHDNIEHELLAFHSKLASLACPAELEAIARYLLCATIDELLAKNYLRLYGQVTEFKAFTPVSADSHGPERHFFDIVRAIREHPAQYLDLVELAYFCLIAGFEGEHHLQANGRQTLDNLTEDLYQLVRQYRVPKPHQLLKENVSTPHFQKRSKRPLILAMACATTLFTLTWVVSHVMLESKARDVLSHHTVLARAGN